MKIFIKHLPNTLNYGSMMMGENLIYYLEQKLRKYNPEFYTDTKHDFHIERLREATKYDKIYKDEIFNYKLITQKIKYVRYIERKIKEKFLYKKASKYYDAIVMLGGDDFSEVYYNIPEDNLTIKNIFKQLTTLNRSGQFYMIGQTIGPYTDVRKKWAKECFKDIKIYSRDDESAKYMLEEIDKEVFKSRDLAFLDLGLQEEYVKNHKDILNKYDLKENEYITFVGTGLIRLYSKNEDNVVDTYLDIIKKAKERYPDKKLVWLSHVTTRNSTANDNNLLEKINKKHNNFINKNMVVIREEILPIEARIILGFGIFTITCRMHAAVSTFQMGKPAVCLSYSPKYKGVIGHGLKMSELVIESKSDELWRGEIVDLIEEKMSFIDENYEQITSKIRKQIEECKIIVSDTITEISQEISENL